MVLVNLLIKPFWVFGIDRTVQNTLGESEYGLYFAIFNFTYLFQILLDFGLQNYNNREIAADRTKINTLLPSILFFKTGLFLVYLVLCVAVAYPLGYLAKPFIWIILVNQIILSFNIYLRTNISAHQQFIKDALLSVLDKLLMIIFCAVLIWGNINGLELTIFNFALAQLAAFALTFLVCLYYSVRLTTRLQFTLSLKHFPQIARETMPYAIIHFLMTTYYRIDGVMLERLQGSNGAAESGVYAQGYRIMEALNNIGYLFATILLPLFAYRLTRHSEIKTLLKSSLSIIYCVSVSLIICFFWYRVEIMSLLYRASDIYYSAEVFAYLLLNFFPVAILYVIGTLLTANKNFKLMIATLVVAVLLNIGLNYVLILQSGAKGAGQATLITQFFMLACYSMYTVYLFRLRLNPVYLLQLAAFAVGSILLMLLIGKIHFSANEIYNLLGHILIYLACVPVLSYLLGLINLHALQLKVGIEE
jgi:O-antigen/teichoic acid export membrane protein